MTSRVNGRDEKKGVGHSNKVVGGRIVVDSSVVVVVVVVWVWVWVWVGFFFFNIRPAASIT